MSERTGIAWTDHTFNPWWGCTKVSPGCANCYAEGEARRRGHDVWGPRAARRGFGDAHWKEPERWNRAAMRDGRPHRVFCASMADVFERVGEVNGPGLPIDERDYLMEGRRGKLWALIERTLWLRWQLLTKRPENVASMIPEDWRNGLPGNVWLGTSAEDQERLEQRLPHLLRIRAGVLFLSLEPLLGPIDLLAALQKADPYGFAPLRWVIVGGESGPRARPMDPAWVVRIQDECHRLAIPFFLKQWGAATARTLGLKDPKGSDPEEWSLRHRVQQFPDDWGRPTYAERVKA